MLVLFALDVVLEMCAALKIVHNLNSKVISNPEFSQFFTVKVGVEFQWIFRVRYN